jgi:hypothetical protein
MPCTLTLETPSLCNLTNPPRTDADDKLKPGNPEAAASLNEDKETLLHEAGEADEAAMELRQAPLAAVAAWNAVVAMDAMAAKSV